MVTLWCRSSSRRRSLNLEGPAYMRPKEERTHLLKYRVTHVAALSLMASLALGAAALADGPPNMKPAAAVKKVSSTAKKSVATVKKTSVATAKSDPGKVIVERACQACHDLGTVTQARHTAKQWPGVVVRMRANGADLTDAELKQVQDYLVKTYAVTP